MPQEDAGLDFEETGTGLEDDTAPDSTDGQDGAGTAPEAPSQEATDTDTQASAAQEALLDPTQLPTPKQWSKFISDYKAAQGRLSKLGQGQSSLDRVTQTNAQAWKNATTRIPGLVDLFRAHLQDDPQGIRTALERIGQAFGVQGGAAPAAAPGASRAARGAIPDEENPLLGSREDFAPRLVKLIEKTVRGLMEPHLGNVYEDLGQFKMQQGLERLQGQGWSDLPKYREQIEEILRNDRSGTMTIEDAYAIAKMRGGGWAKAARPNRASTFSEGAGRTPSGPSEEDQIEAVKRAILNAGAIGTL